MIQKSQTKISFVIVNRNTKELLRDCLESIPQALSKVPYDIWIVDNASKDGSSEMISQDYPNIHLIRNVNNLGFAKANNQALKKITSPFALLLNSDTVLKKDCILNLYNFLMDHPHAAIVGPKLINPKGTLQPSTYPLPRIWKNLLTELKFYGFLPKRIKARLFLGSFWNHDETRPVGRITGACILIRMEDIRSLNFFDEEFFFYGEVHDLCWRLWERCREVWFYPYSEVVHLAGQTSKDMWDYKEQRRRMWRMNEKLLRKHQPPSIVRIGLLIKWVGLLIGVIKEKVKSHKKDKPVENNLLKIDFSWHSGRIKEWFWFRSRNLYGLYYKRSFYSTRFEKKLLKNIKIHISSDSEFKTEADRIQRELTDKWIESQDSWERTGLMDFSCSALIYQLIRKLKPVIVVETGVANGASSTFILSAMEANGIGKLYSIDWFESEALSFVPKGKKTGWMVPNELRTRWDLIIGRTEKKLEPLLKQIGMIDIFLHDSDHSYEAMKHEYKTALPYIKKKGFLLSDDVRMNTAFDEFTIDNKMPNVIYRGRLGIAKKR